MSKTEPAAGSALTSALLGEVFIKLHLGKHMQDNGVGQLSLTE